MRTFHHWVGRAYAALRAYPPGDMVTYKVAQRLAHARQDMEHEARIQVGANLEQQLRRKA
jgi:hypothetical protein